MQHQEHAHEQAHTQLTQPATIEPIEINNVIGELTKTVPVYEITIDGDSYVCPSADEVTVLEYDKWVLHISSYPDPVKKFPPEVMASKRKLRKWTKAAHHLQTACFAAYWYGIPAEVAIHLPKDVTDAIIHTAYLTFCPPAKPDAQIQINGTMYTLNRQQGSSGNHLTISGLTNLLHVFLLSEYGEQITFRQAGEIPLSKAFAILRQWSKQTDLVAGKDVAGNSITMPDLINKLTLTI